MNQKIIEKTLDEFEQAIPPWKQWIAISFLSQGMQESYFRSLEARWQRLILTEKN